MVPEHADGDLQQVLALRRFVQAISYTIGPAVGALAVTLTGPRRALLLKCSDVRCWPWLMLATVPRLDALRRPPAGRPTTAQGLGGSACDSMLERACGVPSARRWSGGSSLYWTVVMATVAIVMAAAIVWFEEDLGVADAGTACRSPRTGSAPRPGLAWPGSRTFRLPLTVT